MFGKKRKANDDRNRTPFMDSPRRKKALQPRTLIAAGLAFVLTAAVLLILLNPSALVIASVSREDAFQATNLLSASLTQKRFTYVDFLENEPIGEGPAAPVAVPVVRTLSPVVDLPADTTDPSDGAGGTRQAVEILFGESAEYVVTAEAGYYNLSASFMLPKKSLNTLSLALEINGEVQYEEMGFIDVPLIWRDTTKQFPHDSFGDEIIPAQIPDEGWQSFQFYDSTYISSRPLLVRLEAGDNTVRLTNTSVDRIYLADFAAAEPAESPTYAQYITEQTQAPAMDLIELDAISYANKSSSYIQLQSGYDPSLSPFDPINKKLNIIGGGSWDQSGQMITYHFTVKQAGSYHLALHGMADKDDFSVFRSIWIDGRLPFQEAANFAVPAYADNQWHNLAFSDPEGLPYAIYLEQGDHTLRLRVETEPIAQALRDLQLMIDHLNQFRLDVLKVVGRDLDKNRTWKLSRYIPDTANYLNAYDTILRRIVTDLAQYTGKSYKSADLAPLAEAIVLLDKLREKPDELPLHLESLVGGSASVLQLVGNAMDQLLMQGLSLDTIYLYGDAELPPANAPITEKASSSVRQLAATYISPKYVVRNDPEAINIWVNSTIIHVDALQKLIDARFTAETGIKARISIMPDANKLVLASAAGTAPDIALALESYRPFELASRGAAYDMTTFDDFWEVAGRFAPGSIVPFIFNSGVFALPESLDFYALAYREDIFSSLNLSPPDTWQDVGEIMPELQRYGMNFYHPIASGEGYKWYYQTCPLIFQNGGKIYSDDGLRVVIDSPEAVKGVTELGELFTTYALSEQIPVFFNAFRSGTVPAGIIDLSTYLILKNGAPELTGQWNLAPFPGTTQADGSVSRWFITNGRCGMIFKDTDKPEVCWEFFKWWLSEEIQTEYAFTLQSTYGPLFMWLPSNLDAVANSSLDERDKQVILEQVKWLRDVPRTPGQYMTERSLSDIWNMIVFDGVSAQVAIDSKLIIIQREMKRKMIEYGFLDEDGRQIKPYVIRDIDWVVEQIETKGGG